MNNKYTYSKSIEWLNNKNKAPTHNRIINFLIEEYLKDIHFQVSTTIKNWNLKTRDIVKNLIGFSLHYKKLIAYNSSGQLHSNDLQEAVRIEISNDIPPQIIDLIDAYDKTTWSLILEKKSIENSMYGVGYIKGMQNEILKEIKIESDYNSFEAVEKDLQTIINYVNTLNVNEKIKNIHGDILGTYHPGKKEIKLYWFAIGLLALILNVSIENLTLIVLAHELAHAYTHLGFDIDGNQWKLKDFMDSELEIVEGIAEYYSRRFAELHNDKKTGLIDTYELLLSISPPCYKKYTEWFDDKTDEIGEAVRYALIISRQQGKKDYKTFMELIAEGKQKTRIIKKSQAKLF